MIDISEIMRSVARREFWSPADSERVIRHVTVRRGLDLDWDEGADEGWASCLSGGSVVALISSFLPLCISIGGASDLEEARVMGCEVISVASFNEPELSCQIEALESAFGNRLARSHWDPNSFSASDLWYATV